MWEAGEGCVARWQNWEKLLSKLRHTVGCDARRRRMAWIFFFIWKGRHIRWSHHWHCTTLTLHFTCFYIFSLLVHPLLISSNKNKVGNKQKQNTVHNSHHFYKQIQNSMFLNSYVAEVSMAKHRHSWFIYPNTNCYNLV